MVCNTLGLSILRAQNHFHFSEAEQYEVQVLLQKCDVRSAGMNFFSALKFWCYSNFAFMIIKAFIKGFGNPFIFQGFRRGRVKSKLKYRTY